MFTNYKRIVFVALICCFALLNGTCKKKISKYPFEMEGMWYAPDGFTCGGPVLVIEKNGNGRWLGQSGECDTREPDKSGKVKYNRNNILFIGDKSFTIVEKPEAMGATDSIVAPYADDLTSKILKKYPSLAKMTIQKRKVIGEEGKYIFYKYVDY